MVIIITIKMAIIMEPNTNEKNKKTKTTIDPAAPSTAAVFLPEELICEMLLRLPAKSLARFRTVCRSWNRLLRSDSDAAFQRLYSDRQQASVGRRRLAFAAAVLAPAHPWEVCEGLTMTRCADCPRFVGGGGKPCHGGAGVVLLSQPCTAAYALCNVSTGGVLRLPPCPTVGFLSAAGVGYDAATDEFKVVQLALVTNRPVWESLDCHVLTVGAAANGGVRGGWRSLAVAVGGNSNVLIEPMDPVFANGCLHWTLATGMLLLRDDEGKPAAPEGILSFCLATESFATVPVPAFVAADLVPYDDDHPHACRLRTAGTSDHRVVTQPIGTALAELDGCLCMIRDLRRRDDVAATMFEVWKLKDYDSGVWSLDYRIHEDLLAAPSSSSSSLTTKKLMEPWLVIPICYLPSDDDDDDKTKRKILLVTTAHDVHVYDPRTATLETIASAAHCCNYPDPASEANEVYLVLRQESLLHINGMEYGAKGITTESII